MTWVSSQLLTQFFQSLAEAFNDALVWLMALIVQKLMTSTMPSVEDLMVSRWFMIGAGGTLVLASVLVAIVAVAITIYSVITPLRNHSMRWSRAITSVLTVAVFGAVFFDVYSLLYQASLGANQGALNLMLSTENATATDLIAMATVAELDKGSNPVIGAFMFLVALLLNGIVGLIVYGMQILLYAGLVLYPLAIAIRPLGDIASKALHALSGSIGAIILAPPLMIIGYTLPFVAPGSDDPFARLVWLLVGGLLAIFAPSFAFYMFYKGSKSVFGRVDASISGAVDINSMPPTTPQEIQQSVSDTHESALRTFAASAVPGIIGAVATSDGEDMTRKIREVVVDGAGIAITVAGHPHVATAINVIDTATRPKPADTTNDGHEQP